MCLMNCTTLLLCTYWMWRDVVIQCIQVVVADMVHWHATRSCWLRLETQDLNDLKVWVLSALHGRKHRPPSPPPHHVGCLGTMLQPSTQVLDKPGRWTRHCSASWGWVCERIFSWESRAKGPPNTNWTHWTSQFTGEWSENGF